MVWIYRIALYALLFGVSALTYGGNALSPLLDKAVNVMALVSIPALILFYFRFPALYKVAAWLLFLGVFGLILESMYEYNQFMYSYFVVKRFVYCGLALTAFYVVERAEPLKMQHAVLIIVGLYVVNQLFLGQIFSYALTSESRTTSAPEALYLVIPFLYYLVRYIKERSIWDLFKSLFAFAFIVFLLHRSVISAAVVAAGAVFGLIVMGRVQARSLPFASTIIVLAVIISIGSPLLTLLPENKVDSFIENIGGIFSPKEDETGSWRYEQSQHYLKLIPERPLLGWRYVGYDRGEVMENEDFPEKGTIIHSQYIDMLYNYGFVGLAINLLILIGTLWVIYRRNRVFTDEQLVLFGFITSGLIFAVSYQLPPYFWGFVGVGMFYGLKRPALTYVPDEDIEDVDFDESDQATELSKNHSNL